MFVDTRAPAGAQYHVSHSDAAIAEAKVKRARRYRIQKQLTAFAAGEHGSSALAMMAAVVGGDGAGEAPLADAGASAAFPASVTSWASGLWRHAADMAEDLDESWRPEARGAGRGYPRWVRSPRLSRAQVIAKLIESLAPGPHGTVIADPAAYAASSTRRLLVKLNLQMGGLLASSADASIVGLVAFVRRFSASSAATEALGAVLAPTAPRPPGAPLAGEGEEVLSALRAVARRCEAGARSLDVPSIIPAAARGPASREGPGGGGLSENYHRLPRAMPAMFAVALAAGAGGVTLTTRASAIEDGLRSVLVGIMDAATSIINVDCDYMAALSLPRTPVLPRRPNAAFGAVPPSVYASMAAAPKRLSVIVC